MTKLLKSNSLFMTTRGVHLDKKLKLPNSLDGINHYTFLLSDMPADVLGFISCNYQILIDNTTYCPLINATDTHIAFMRTSDGGAFWTGNCERHGPSADIPKFLKYIGYEKGNTEDSWSSKYTKGRNDPPLHEKPLPVPKKSTRAVKKLSPLTKEVYLKCKRATTFVKGSLLLGESGALTYFDEALDPDGWYEGQNEVGGNLFNDGMLMLTLLDVIDDFQNGAEYSYGFDKEEFYYCKEDKSFYVK